MVIAIIGILVSLLLPAVQSAREAARRMQCSNNLKQIGLALHNYHTAHETLPYGTPFDNAGGADTGGTWAAMILPFIEQQNLYDSFDFTVLMTDPLNADAVQVPIETYICPSDGSASKALFDDRDNLSGTNPSPSVGLWYPVSMGPTEPDTCSFCAEPAPSYCCQGNNYGSTSPENNSVGMFGRHPGGFTFDEVRDGLSNTIMGGESIPSQCIYVCVHCVNFPIAGTSIPLNNFETVDVAGGVHYRACGFKSRHPGGAMFVLGDGSVRFFPDSIDYQLYNELGTRSGGEVVTLP